ncbi:SGNH/GDSL hydrolase family protein [Gracilibacillus oryzae]|uniref:SGNH/GDSL hydrolase family protein n=1 Tax=Gracilibacillus oryzae TaxID=1672701 RepID=A0A7C8KRN3_9BACI|nr:SGNH/GDSL hydrolase family protein [Gracilibacillus oryzae]KAB8125597.1 SGNH/GDSL hydrolase family protein [Gracilibacillus oryzae]
MNLGKRLVLIGDSITEWGKNEDPEGIGRGYVRLIHDYLRVTEPEKNYEIFNKGIGGNRITDLEARWQEDVLDLMPDTVSISIGINDVWRQLDQPELEQVAPDKFEQKYRKLLSQIKAATHANIILMEPTIINEEINSEGNQKLKAYVEIVNKLAGEFDTLLVPTHQAFIEYLQKDSRYYLTTDGVHMNSAGNLLMANQWIKAVKNL